MTPESLVKNVANREIFPPEDGLNHDEFIFHKAGAKIADRMVVETNDIAIGETKDDLFRQSNSVGGRKRSDSNWRGYRNWLPASLGGSHGRSRASERGLNSDREGSPEGIQ